MNYKKNKYYCNNNIYPIKQKNENNNNNLISPLYEVENFLSSVNKAMKFIKFIKYFK